MGAYELPAAEPDVSAAGQQLVLPRSDNRRNAARKFVTLLQGSGLQDGSHAAGAQWERLRG